MRNLRSIRYARWSAPAARITSSAWDVATESVLCTYGPDELDPIIQLVRVKHATKIGDSGSSSLIASWDWPCPNPDMTRDTILSLHYFADTLTACLVFAGGDIVVVREDPQFGEEKIEVVGSVEIGITGAQWSPDEELLAITTKANTLVFMSRSFEGVTDVQMTSEDLKASNHVSVGWGKKETQFKGRGARALRDPTVPEKVDEGVLSPNDNGKVSISWRGDGAFVAVSSIESQRRLIRVYSREGELDSASEPVDGLEGALSWRPAGNLLAAIQRFEDHFEVVFFERNGLRHGQFSLRLTPEQLAAQNQCENNIRLAWNSDSTVLAVILHDSTQLWTMGNYHWYLKQELSVRQNNSSGSISAIWHPEKALKLLISTDDFIIDSEFIFYIAKGTTAPPNDFGSVAVIDGQNLRLTPLRNANIPPPMALHEVDLPSNAIDVAFHSRDSLFAVLHQRGFIVFQWEQKPKSSAEPLLIASLDFSPEDYTKGSYLQIALGDDSQIFLLQYQEGAGTLIQKYVVEGKTLSPRPLDIDVPFSVASVCTYEADGASYIYNQSTDGNIQNLSSEAPAIAKSSIREQLPYIEFGNNNGIPIAFRMSRNGHLYADSRLLVKNCTSFLVTHAHLVYTTTTHLLKFVHITDVDNLDVPPDNPEIDERCRSIERGAQLVTAMPTSLSLVLQMPRGNLETIWPRAMVVSGIRSLIEAKDYKAAFLHCRTQRVDMNILYDHMPEQFLSNVALFIDQVKKVSYIDLFLSSLREEDVTKTMYQDTRPQQTQAVGTSTVQAPLNPKVNSVANVIPGGQSTQIAGGSAIHAPLNPKVNTICDAFLEVLKSRTATNLQNIITANVCKNPPALDDGLSVVAKLMREDEKLAEKAVEHICFLADVNKLYGHALGLYDLELAVLVAQQSQKDPREYLPFVQNLSQMTQLRRQFSVDDYLGRHGKALGYLNDMDAFDEVKSYTQKHVLYKEALGIYRYNEACHAEITALYAAYLESVNKLREAGLAHESIGNFEKATSCYKAAAMWRECLFAASQQSPSPSQEAIQSLAGELADAMIESKDFVAAATIQLNYLHDLGAAATTYCKGYQFSTALQLVGLHNRPDILPLIDSGIASALAATTDLLAECRSQLGAQVPRIVELREKAAQNPLAFYGNAYQGEDNDLPDNISVAASSRISTSASLFTRYTGRHSQGTAATGVSRATSKNRRREERKRARGKKGSVYEEEYLVASVGRLVKRVDTVRAEVRDLVECLIRRGMWERARAVEALMGNVVKECRAAMTVVYGVAGQEAGMLQNGETAEGGDEQYRATGGDAVLQESIEASMKKLEPPILGAFERLSLLGS